MEMNKVINSTRRSARLKNKGTKHIVKQKKEIKTVKDSSNVLTNFISSLKQKYGEFDLDTLILSCEEYERRFYKPKKNNNNKNSFDILVDLLPELRELQSMIGLNTVKQTIVNHIMFLAQDLHDGSEMNHIQITGDSGVGKTTLAIIIGRIYAKIGLLEYGNVITATRSDFIGEHLGSTTLKTQDTLESCIGNVLFIDEIYSFGSEDRKDSFSKECIDCITQFLSEHRNEILCIIAGYEDDIKKCFLSVNKGLERRFGWKYKIEPYTVSELQKIFETQIHLNNWKIDDNASTALQTIFNERNKHVFTFSGGDTEILFTRCKMAHSSRIFFEKNSVKRSLNSDDILKGYQSFLNYKQCSETKSQYGMMYI